MISRVYRAVRRILHLPRAQAVTDSRIEGLQQSGGLTRQDAARLSDQLNLVLHELSLMTRRQLDFQRETRLLLGQMSLPRAEIWQDGLPEGGGAPGDNIFPNSTVCRQESFEAPYFAYWTAKVGHALRFHRKTWEFVFICQALYERGLLRPGARGLGFGVGGEPLTAFFAAEGCRITATDMAPEAAAGSGWVETAQHAGGKEALRRPFCPAPMFDANVEFRFCDMNHVPDDLKGYDFCWSACALEHLGSIEHGLAFIQRSLDCLKPGGFAVHTTEFNLSSNDETVTEGSTVLFRKRDMEELSRRVAAAGHTMAPLDLNPGYGEVDRYIDVPPYRVEPHLKLALQGYAATSIGVIIRKGGG